MKEKLVIILTEFKVREFDFLRYDVKELQENEGFKVQFHDLTNYFNPGFSEAFSNVYESNLIKKFTNFQEWKKEIKTQKNKFGKNILILCDFQNHSLKYIKVNYLIKSLKIKTVFRSNFDLPSKNALSILDKAKWLFGNIFFNRKKLIIFLRSNISLFIGRVLDLKPDFFLKTGKNSNLIEKKLSKKIIEAHSLDYNLYLKSKNKKFNSSEEYGLFLESPSPVHSGGDNFLLGYKADEDGTKENWLKSVNKFLSMVESKLNIKILIAPHPKIKYQTRTTDLYDGREILSERLSIGCKNAKILISRNSQGASFAAIHKIPTVFIYTNELKEKKNNFLRYQKIFANSFGLDPINIDEEISDKMFKKIITFKNEYYKEYIDNYLTARKDDKLNYKIISDIFNF